MIIKEPFSSSRLPLYHDATLIMKIRPSSTGPAGALSMSAAAATVTNAPGIAALSFFERGGLIKKVTSIAKASRHGAPLTTGSPMGILAASASNKSDKNAGVNLVELEHERDVDDLQRALASDPNIEFVSRVPVRYLAITGKAKIVKKKSVRGAKKSSGAVIAAEPPPPSTMWNLHKVRWADALAQPNFADAINIKVGVLDTGIDPDHPDLTGRIASYTFAHPDIPGASGNKDIIGHGTHVAGTIMANSSNSIGINGVCSCEMHSWKIFDDQDDFAGFDDGFVYFVDTAMYHRALADCAEQGIDVINLSIGGGGAPDPNEQLLFDTLLAGGTTVVAAMGNERQFGSPTSFPAAIPGVIAVGATNIDDKVANFSNRGNHIAVSAPGVSIWSTLPTYPGRFGFEAIPGANGPIRGMEQKRETDYDAWNGTSMATPHVVAAVALLFSNKGKMSPAEALAELKAAADKVPAMGGNTFHPDFGAGRLNLLRLLE